MSLRPFRVHHDSTGRVPAVAAGVICLVLGLSACASGSRPADVVEAFVHAPSLKEARGYLLHPDKTTVLENKRHSLFTPAPYPVVGEETLAPDRVVVWVKGVAVSGFVHPDIPCGFQLVRQRRSWKIDLGATLADPQLLQRNKRTRQRQNRQLRRTLTSLRRAVRAYHRSYDRWPVSLAALRGKTPYVVTDSVPGYRFRLLPELDERGEPYIAALSDDGGASFTITLIGEKRGYPPPARP